MKKVYIKDWVSISNQGFFSKENQGLVNAETLKTELNNIHRLPTASIPEILNSEIENLKFNNIKFNKLDRTVKLAIYLASKFSSTLHDCGISIGSSRAATELFERYFTEFKDSNTACVSPLASPLTTHGNISSNVARVLNNKSGVNLEHSVTCSSGLFSIIDALVWIESKRINEFIAGGVEAPLTDFTISQMKALNIYTDSTCYPFNKSKNSFLLGEGGTLFHLSNKSSSQHKNIFISNFGTSIETDQSFTGISKEGNNFYNAMEKAISGKKTPDVILAHASGTLNGDSSEFNSIKKLFANNMPYIYSTKAFLGHTLGASGPLSMAVACELLSGLKVPEFNYGNIIGEQKIPNKINSVLINTAGFGGNAMSILLEI